MKNPTFYKVSFWLKGIITDSRPYCFFEADCVDHAFKKFYNKFGHIDVHNITVTPVKRNTTTYNTLISLYKGHEDNF